MTHQEAIEKVAKLLRLAQSSNENEAALAAQRAQEIMSKFKIDSLMMEDAGKTEAESDNEPIVDFGGDVLWQGHAAKSTYRVRLAQHIAQQNQVALYLKHNGIALVGRASDCTTVRYLYLYFQREVERLCREKCKGNSCSYKHAWMNGCVATIGEKLSASKGEVWMKTKLEAKGNSLAMVRVEQAMVRMEKRQKRTDEFFAEMSKDWRGGRSTKNYHGDAYARGRQDGHSVRMTSAKGSLSAGSKQIGGGL